MALRPVYGWIPNAEDSFDDERKIKKKGRFESVRNVRIMFQLRKMDSVDREEGPEGRDRPGLLILSIQWLCFDQFPDPK